MSDVGLVVAAAGGSQRFGAGQDKLLTPLDGLPVLCHCLRTFLPRLCPELVVVVVPAGREAPCRDALAVLAEAGAGLAVVAGGTSRQESVCRGLRALPAEARIVAIQDAARPYTSASLLSRCVDSARSRGSGVAARRVTDTVKVADASGLVRATLDRSTLWATETPQVFQRQLIEAAYQHVARLGQTVTDDAQAVEMLGEPTYLVEHQERNPKITYRSDLPV